MKNKKKLKGTNFSVRKDFLQNTRIKRVILNKLRKAMVSVNEKKRANIDVDGCCYYRKGEIELKLRKDKNIQKLSQLSGGSKGIYKHLQ